ncbi:helix-turn-helix domain-containing protein [Bacillus marasmi]|uniref:helix-turn-helix domain-containing protein n=1 Tax=Bacillus marasmi TaxID=1926279 RepID=UPI0011CA258D|nr:helix-turn-helix transcriptional regulator [Bacillus marasmi]
MRNRETIQISKVLMRLRKKKNLSQEELAFRSKVASRSITYYESDRKSPNLTTLFYLSKGLGMKPYEFIKEIEKEINWNRENYSSTSSNYLDVPHYRKR